MTHYNRYYDGPESREAKDKRAIEDIKEYLGTDAKGKEKFDLLVEGAESIGRGGRPVGADKITVLKLNFIFGMAGITGRPFHAFCRKYCLGPYKEWLLSSDGGDPVPCDEEGFWANDELQEARD